LASEEREELLRQAHVAITEAEEEIYNVHDPQYLTSVKMVKDKILKLKALMMENPMEVDEIKREMSELVATGEEIMNHVHASNYHNNGTGTGIEQETQHV
jgi:hypothetical protein